jgi:hypothetical protein
MSVANPIPIIRDNNTPLKIFQPMNFIVYLTFFSPIVVAIGITSLSFIFQNFKGLIYLGFLLGSCAARYFVYNMTTTLDECNQEDLKKPAICNSIEYMPYGNSSFSSFIFAFTIMYLSIPMFSNDSVNFWIFSSMIVYFFADISIKYNKGCIIKPDDLFLNILVGAATASLMVTLMYAGGSGQYLFFNEMSSNKEMCYQPSKQNFKCSVYSNGELISEL